MSWPLEQIWPPEPLSEEIRDLAIEIRLLLIPTVAALHTARSTKSQREKASDPRQLVMVRLIDPDGFEGWGECSALNEIGYSHESARSSLAALIASQWPDPDELPMAASAIEMAHLDLRLRKVGLSLAAALGVGQTLVPAGAAVGLMGASDTLEEVSQLMAEGYTRIKLKIGPEHILEVPTAVRSAFPALEIQVDANGSLGENDLDQLNSLVDLEVAAIEQPFPIERPELAAQLAALLDVPIVADESAPNIAAVKELAERGALSGVSIKPPRVGGLRRALDLLAFAVENDLAATAGGMLESALGRHSLAAFAACEGLTLTGDLSPSGRWLKEDPWPDLQMTDGMIVVPQGPGVAPLPDLELVDHLSVTRWSTVT